MVSYIVRRLLQFIPVLFLASIAVWAIIYAVPGSPATALVGTDATPEALAAAEQRLGLDKPVPLQYLQWLSGAVVGDFGDSAINGAPVLGQLAERIPASLQLAFFSLMIGLLLALPLGIVSALQPRSVLTKVINVYQAAALAIPTFWVGILLIIGLAVKRNVFPSVSNFVPLWVDPVGAFRHTFLPALCLGIYISGIIARFVSASLKDTLAQDYVRTARAKGAGEMAIMSRHVLRNSLVPILTQVVMAIPFLFTGSLLLEAGFGIPGLGAVTFEAIQANDFSTLRAMVFLGSLLFILGQILTDISYTLVDPRIRLQ